MKIHESLKILIEYIEKTIKEVPNKTVFICTSIAWDCKFTVESNYNGRIKNKLLEYFISNKPTNELHTSFYNSVLFNRDLNPVTWWKRKDLITVQDVNEERLKFLNYLYNLALDQDI